MFAPIHITSISTISALGSTSEEIWDNYLNHRHYIQKKLIGKEASYASFLSEEIVEELQHLRNSEPRFQHLDATVLMGIYCARKATEFAEWKKGESIGINIGSSRGATQLFEKYHQLFLEKAQAEVLASPSTTLGNISSWIAQDLESSGPEISHSVTCSTGMHAILNGIAWLRAEMAHKFLVGGSEAALTPFTIGQMKAMKIYASEDLDFPCRALDREKKRNSMVLGEAAGVLCLEQKSENSIAQIIGIGYATEKLQHSVSISADAECFQKSMKMAAGDIPLNEIDAIVMHAPGTIKGDSAELNAINTVFGNHSPALTSNKWKIGHSFGASGILSMEMAVLILQNQQFINVPFAQNQYQPEKLEKIMVNAVGFGGNAVSILIGRK